MQCSDDDAEHKDPGIAPQLESMLRAIQVTSPSPAADAQFAQAGMSSSAREFFAREFDFFGQITGVSGRIRQFELGPARKARCMAVSCCAGHG